MKAYPTTYESWWLKRASSHFGGTAENHVLQKLEATVSKLSDSYTLLRDDTAPESYNHSQEILAYGLFFFPQTYTRTSWVADELLKRLQWRPATDRPIRILDLGCGSGAASFSLLDRLEQSRVPLQIEHFGVDRSGHNLDAARELGETRPYQHLEVKSEWLRRDVTSAHFSWQKKPFHQPWDIILMSFSFGEFVAGLENEQAIEVMRDLGDVLQESGIVIVTEPSLMETSVRLEAVRNAIAEDPSFQILAPCLHQQACPALEKRKFWCHEVRKWHPPESIAYLNTRLHRDIRFLKFSFLIFGKMEESPNTVDSENYFRLISPASKKAGQLVCRGCAADGRINTYEWLTRHLNKDQIKNHLDLERGDCIQEKNLRALGTEGRYRIEQEK